VTICPAFWPSDTSYHKCSGLVTLRKCKNYYQIYKPHLHEEPRHSKQQYLVRRGRRPGPFEIATLLHCLLSGWLSHRDRMFGGRRVIRSGCLEWTVTSGGRTKRRCMKFLNFMFACVSFGIRIQTSNYIQFSWNLLHSQISLYVSFCVHNEPRLHDNGLLTGHADLNMYSFSCLCTTWS
jgi:hypothetical protein